MKRKKAFICMTAFDLDLCDDNAGFIDVYGSVNALKDNNECWEECGIYEVEIKVKRTAAKPLPWEEIEKRLKANVKVCNEIIGKYTKRKARK